MSEADPPAFQKFGAYEVIGRLGKGGMGEVFRAHDAKLGRDVAIKTLPPEAAGESEWLARFRREARSLASLNHPNIAVVHGLEESNGVHYLIMELVEGDTLAERARRSGPLPVTDALSLCTQVVDALEAAHQKGIIHRDIKPANIKVTPEGRVKVLDFGLAKQSAASASGQDTTMTEMSVLGRIVGTPGYMSPEQVRGRNVDHRCDLWALGCVLFELLASKRTFAGETASDVLAAILEREPNWDALPASTPIKIREFLRRCLDKDVERRFQTAAELKAALSDIRESPGTSWGFARLQTKRARRGLLALTAGVLLIVAGIVLYPTIVGIREPREPPPAAMVAAAVKPLTSLPGWEFDPSWSRDGSFVVFSNNRFGSMDIFAMPAAGGDPIQLTKGPADEISARWSPDGKYLAYVADQGAGASVYLAGQFGGGDRKLIDTGVSALLRFIDGLALLGTMPWSPDGKELLFAKVTPPGDTAIWRINVETGTQTQVTFPKTGETDLSATWSFDGARIAYSRRQAGATQTYAIPAAGGEPMLLFADSFGGGGWASDNRRFIFTSLRSGLLNLWEVNADDPRRLRQLTNGQGWDIFPSSSPGGRIAFVIFNHQVDLYEATPGSRTGDRDDRRVTDHTGENFHPSFSRDGREIVYQSDRTGGTSEIWKRDLVTKQETRLTSNDVADVAPDWSPTADEIAFVSVRGGKPQVWIMDADGGSVRRLSEKVVPFAGGGWDDAQVIPRWSPDGKSIGFLAASESTRELWVVDRDGDNARKVLSGVLYFDWFRDNRHIVFSSETNAAAEVRALDLETGKNDVLYRGSAIELAVSRAPGQPTLLFTHALSHFGMNLFTLKLRAAPNGMPVKVGDPVQITNGLGEWHVHKGQWSPNGRTIIYTRDADQGNIFTIDNYK